MMSKGYAKRKVTLHNKFFNYKKMCHFGRNYTASTTHKKNKSDDIQRKRSNNQYQVHITITKSDVNKSEPKSFKPGKANMIRAANLQALKGVWYLDLYTFYHLTNNEDIFMDEFQPKCLDFTTTDR